MAVTKLSEKNKDFFHTVFQVVRLIPSGRVTSYGAIANYLGVKSGARMVGWAMNASHTQEEYVPAHRVVNRQGLLTGRHHFDPPEKMELSLIEEGVNIQDHKVVDFNSIFWDPMLELNQ